MKINITTLFNLELKKTKKIFVSVILLSLIVACSTNKRIQKAVSNGDYDLAISQAIGKLKVNKSQKNKADFILSLKDAFNKATARDLDKIDYLKKDGNPEHFIQIYDLYVGLNNREERIKPLQPLSVNGKKVAFHFNNYSSQIIQYKNKASEQVYQEASSLLKSNNKQSFRIAHDELRELENINPNYKDVRQLLEVSHQKGIDFVLVNIINDTDKIIPKRLENDLLNISSYGLNNYWVVYHSNTLQEVDYDYNMRLSLKNIEISPEQIKERLITREKQIKDGSKVLLDEAGETVKDSLGNNIMVDRFKKVTCNYYRFSQFKSAVVSGNLEFMDLKSNQLIDNVPISSQFVFNHDYATANGNRNALEPELLPFLNERRMPFPSEEEMIYLTGEDLKLKLKNVINSYNFSR